MSERYFTVLGQAVHAAQFLELALARHLLACKLYSSDVSPEELLREVHQLDRRSLGRLCQRMDSVKDRDVLEQLAPLVDERNHLVHHQLRSAPERSWIGATEAEELARLVEVTRRFLAGGRKIGEASDRLMDFPHKGALTARDAGFAFVGRAYAQARAELKQLEWQPPDLATS